MARLGWPLLVALAWTILLFLMLPTLVTVPVSLTTHNYLSLPDEGISFQHYAKLALDPSWRNSIGQSLLIGAVAATLATMLGTMTAIGLWRLSSGLAESVRALALAPMIVPPIVSALAFYKAWAQLGLIDSFTGIIIAHALLALPYVLITVAASLSNVDLRQEQASRSLGAGTWRTIRSVILPQIRTGIVTGGLFAFIVSWDEIVVTLFVATRAVYTLPRKMWDGIREALDPSIAAAGTVLFLLTLLIIVGTVLRTGRKAGLPEG